MLHEKKKLVNKNFHSWFATDEESDESYETRHKKGKFKKKRKKKFKIRKKYKKFIMPLLIAYKLKFFTLIPVFIGKLLFFVKFSLLKNVSGLIYFSLLKLERYFWHHKKKRKKFHRHWALIVIE